MGCLLEMVKGHFHKVSPKMSEAQRAEQTKRLLASLPEGTSLSEQMVRMAAELQFVETIAMCPTSPSTDFVGVNMYVDDQAQVKNLPLNPRASSILTTCMCPHQVFGDAFIARVQDDEARDIFKRMDFRLQELNSKADWILKARQLNGGGRSSSSAPSLAAFPAGAEQSRRRGAGPGARPGAGAGAGAGADGGAGQKASPAKGAGGGTGKPEAGSPAEDPAKRAELEKLVGNKLFKQGRYEKAVEHYSRAVDGGEGDIVRVYLNNRAAALLRLGKLAEAEKDCDRILAEEPGNVKALFRRGTARRGQGRAGDALADFERCLKADSGNAEAKLNIQQISEELKLAKQEREAGGAGAGEVGAASTS